MERSQLVLANATIVDVAKGATVGHRTVVVENGLIKDILDSSAPLPEGAVDIQGLFLCPGLIDGHVHFFLDAGVSPRTAFIESNDQTRMEVATRNARVAIEAGITTTRDCGSPVPLIFELQDRVRQGKAPGPHIVSCGSPLTRPKGHCHFMGKEVATRAEMRQAIESHFRQGAAFVKVMASGGGLTPGTNPSEADLPLELMREAADVAHGNGAQVTAHCHATESMQRALAAGLDMIEHASFVESGGRYRYDESLAVMIRDKGVMVSPTVVGALRSAERFRQAGQAHNPDDRSAIARLEGRLTNTSHFHRLGMRIVGGSDCGVTDTPFDSLVDELIAYTRAGMSNVEALRTSTSNNAALMNLPRVGEIKVGFQADLIVLDANPQNDLNALRRPRAVIKSGRIVHTNDQGIPPVG